MMSSNGLRNRKEKVLQAHKVLLRLDDIDFQGTIRLSYKAGEGLMTWALEEHGSFTNGGGKQMAVEEIKKIV